LYKYNNCENWNDYDALTSLHFIQFNVTTKSGIKGNILEIEWKISENVLYFNEKNQDNYQKLAQNEQIFLSFKKNVATKTLIAVLWPHFFAIS
jgi:hypothetical protein